jgi:cellobiose transport system substrate-binding protein
VTRAGGVAATLAATLVAALLLGAGCTAAARTDQVVTLTISGWGDFGFASLLREYHRQHPGIRVVERVEDVTAHHDALLKQLDSGTGAADIAGVDEAYLAGFRSRAGGFYNLMDLGAGKLASGWLDWKWQQPLSADGKVQIGLGTDIGSLGVCYRTDLFAAAGLPTDREQVGRLWPTWEAYLATGRAFAAAGTPARWLDSSVRAYNAIVSQQDDGYYDRAGNVVFATNPGVRRAFDLSLQLIAAGQSAELTSNTARWTAALQAGTFATMLCPGWGLGPLRQNAPDTRGRWDVAAVPGGGGNWGGAFLTLPRQGRHPREAYQLAAWLTAPEQQLTIFKETGNLPSQRALYDNPALREYRSEFMNNAPIGQIFGASAVSLRPQYLGPKTGSIRAVVENTLFRVESGEVEGQQAWATALTEVGAALAN